MDITLSLRPPEPVLVVNKTQFYEYDLEGSPRNQLPYPSTHDRRRKGRFLPPLQIHNLMLQYFMRFLFLQDQRRTPQLIGASDSPSSQPPPEPTQVQIPSPKPVTGIKKKVNRRKPVKAPGRFTIREVPSFEETHYIKRKEEILEYLQPLLVSDSRQAYNVLVCYGKDDRCEVFPVKVSLETDEMEHWEAIRQAWYLRKGRWRKFIPMFGVKGVEKVKISLLGRLDHHCGQEGSIKFRGKYKSLADELNEAQKRMESSDFNFLSDCTYEASKDQIYHGDMCNEVAYCSPDYPEIRPSCSMEELHKAKAILSRLKLRSMFLSAFLDTNVSKVNPLLAEENLIISERDIIEAMSNSEIHCPALAHLEFNGILVQEGWEFDSQHIIIPLAATILLTLIIGSRFIYGDWSTAFTFGGFLVAFVTLLWMWAHHAVS